MKNTSIKTAILATALGSTFVFGSGVRAMHGPSEEEVFTHIIRQLPANFNPEKAKLEDFQDFNQIGSYKLTAVGPAQNQSLPLRQVRPVHKRSRSTLEKCFYDIHFTAISHAVGEVGMTIEFTKEETQ